MCRKPEAGSALSLRSNSVIPVPGTTTLIFLAPTKMINFFTGYKLQVQYKYHTTTTIIIIMMETENTLEERGAAVPILTRRNKEEIDSGIPWVEKYRPQRYVHSVSLYEMTYFHLFVFSFLFRMNFSSFIHCCDSTPAVLVRGSHPKNVVIYK